MANQGIYLTHEGCGGRLIPEKWRLHSPDEFPSGQSTFWLYTCDKCGGQVYLEVGL